jgi:hypothetical protein
MWPLWHYLAGSLWDMQAKRYIILILFYMFHGAKYITVKYMTKLAPLMQYLWLRKMNAVIGSKAAFHVQPLPQPLVPRLQSPNLPIYVQMLARLANSQSLWKFAGVQLHLQLTKFSGKHVCLTPRPQLFMVSTYLDLIACE